MLVNKERDYADVNKLGRVHTYQCIFTTEEIEHTKYFIHQRMKSLLAE